MKPKTALQTLAVTACYLTAITSATAYEPTEPNKLSPIGDSTRSSTGRYLYVYPCNKTSSKTSSTTRQPPHGHGTDVSGARPYAPLPRLPGQYRPGRAAVAKVLHPPFQVYSADAGGIAQSHQDTASAPVANRSQGTDHGKTGTDESGSAALSHQNPSTLLPTWAEPNRTLATNGTATGDDQETIPAATALSASTIWTLVLCALMILAAVAFFAMILAVCRCRQRRERRKKYLTTHRDIQAMKNMVKMAARREKAAVRQGPFGRSSIACEHCCRSK